jgi:hypothetical protein
MLGGLTELFVSLDISKGAIGDGLAQEITFPNDVLVL